MSIGKLSANEIDKIIDTDIFELMGLDHLEDKVKDELREKILLAIENRGFSVLYRTLKEKGLLEQFNQISNENQALDFLKEKEIDLRSIFIQEAIFLKSQLKTASDVVDITAKLGADNKEE